MGYDYEIHYKNRVANVAVDALSRIMGANSLTEDVLSHNDYKEQCKAISYPYGGWMDELRRFKEKDEWIVQKVQQLLQESTTMATRGLTLQSKYHIDNGLLKYKHRVILSVLPGGTKSLPSTIQLISLVMRGSKKLITG